MRADPARTSGVGGIVVGSEHDDRDLTVEGVERSRELPVVDDDHVGRVADELGVGLIGDQRRDHVFAEPRLVDQ